LVDTARTTTTYVGECESAGLRDGQLRNARLKLPYAMADAGDSFFLTEEGNRIRKIDMAAESVTTVAVLRKPIRIGYLMLASGEILVSVDHGIIAITRVGLETWLYESKEQHRHVHFPEQITTLTSGNILIADWGNSRLQLFDTETGKMISVCSGIHGYADGAADSCELYHPWSLLVSGQYVYIGESGRLGGGIRRLTFLADNWILPTVTYRSLTTTNSSNTHTTPKELPLNVANKSKLVTSTLVIILPALGLIIALLIIIVVFNRRRRRERCTPPEVTVRYNTQTERCQFIGPRLHSWRKRSSEPEE